jgi:hypothetical protein
MVMVFASKTLTIFGWSIFDSGQSGKLKELQCLPAQVTVSNPVDFSKRTFSEKSLDFVGVPNCRAFI